MSDNDEKPTKPASRKKPEPATPLAERTPGETAKPNNEVKAKDVFGAPKPDPEWTPEAIRTQTRKPSLEGTDDEVKKEQRKAQKG